MDGSPKLWVRPFKLHSEAVPANQAWADSQACSRKRGMFVNSECLSWKKKKENSQKDEKQTRELHRFLYVFSLLLGPRQRSGEGVVRRKGCPKGCFWRVRFFFAPLWFSGHFRCFNFQGPENLKGAEKKRTLQKHPFGQPFLLTTPSPLLWRAPKSAREDTPNTRFCEPTRESAFLWSGLPERLLMHRMVSL